MAAGWECSGGSMAAEAHPFHVHDSMEGMASERRACHNVAPVRPRVHERNMRRATVKVVAAAAAGAVLVFLAMARSGHNGMGRDGRLASMLSASTQGVSDTAGLPADVTSCIDKAVDPCDDYYSYACGSWVARTTIPADKPLIARSFDGAAAEVHRKLRMIYEEEYPEGSPFLALHNFYASCMNTTRLQELGAAPLEPMLARIDSASTPEELGSIIADFIHLDVPNPLKLTVASAGGPTKVLFVNGGGLVLPDTSFYNLPHLQHEHVYALSPDPHAAERQQLQDYYYELNLLAGYSHEEAMRAANTTIGLETTMAHWTVEEPPIHSVVLDSLSALESVLPSVPLRFAVSDMAAACEDKVASHPAPAEGVANARCSGLQKLVVDEKVVLIGSPHFIAELELSLRTQSAGMWARLLRTHYLYNAATLLSADFLAANLKMDMAATGIRAEPRRQGAVLGLRVEALRFMALVLGA